MNLVFGNGEGLLIQNRDSTIFKFSYTNIYLKTILHVREITKSFLSISKITYENNVFNFFFFFLHLLRPKLRIRSSCKECLRMVYVMLLYWRLSQKINFLFVFHFFFLGKSINCFHSNVPLNKLWHHRLGYPSTLIMNKVANLCKNLSQFPLHFPTMIW